jgi:hypothetical protein
MVDAKVRTLINHVSSKLLKDQRYQIKAYA